nr:hypothetical protein [Hydrogenophaga sp.]
MSQDGLCLPFERQTGRGEFHATRMPREQARAQFLFQFTQFAAEHRLRHGQALGRARQAAGLCHLQEMLELLGIGKGHGDAGGEGPTNA